MTSPQDFGIVFAPETTYKTIPTLSRWTEPLPGAQFSPNKSIKQGQGLRVGARVARSGRRVVVRYDPTAAFDVEVQSKGQGLLWNALMGGATSTVDGTTTTYQQNFTLADNPPSLSIQASLYNAGAATMDPYTYVGMMCDSFDIDFPNADLLHLKTKWKGASVLPNTATAVPAFTVPTAVSNFSFVGGSVSTGTLTAPTTTALASAATALADIRGGSITVNRNLKIRPNLGGDAKPVPGFPQITGKLDIEYDSTTFVQAVLNDTPMALVLTWTTGVAAGTGGNETFQVVLPEVRFDSDVAQGNGDDIPMISGAFQVLDNLTAAQPIWVIYRTADTAL